MQNRKLNIGTCSWKYDSWEGIVYSEKKPKNYLDEYSQNFNTVEVDQWFWSLFAGDKVVMPKASVVREYEKSVPDYFNFCIKIPNSITLTHHYKKRKSDPLIPNPYFLSNDLMNRFLESLEPLSGKLGPLVFQFEYLNKQKMKNLDEFIDRFGSFAEKLPEGYAYCVETRNPNYLGKQYFEHLIEQNLHHVFLQGYYMPSIFDIYNKYHDYVKNLSVIRLLGPDRKDIEKKTGKDWSRIVNPRDKEIELLAEMLNDMDSRKFETYLYVNNHFEGSAPRTITRIKDSI